jgi:hypothetical protein
MAIADLMIVDCRLTIADCSRAYYRVDARVGHTTLIQGNNVRTGVTAILPHTGNLFREKVAGAVFVQHRFRSRADTTEE